MAWGRKQSGPNSTKNQPFSLFFMQFFSLSSPSLSTVAFGHHHSNHYRFVTVSTTSGRLNSSPAAKHTPPIPLSLLQIFFSFFLPALPPETSSNRRPHHCTSSSTARQPPRQVAFFSSFSSSSSSPSPPPLSLLTGWTMGRTRPDPKKKGKICWVEIGPVSWPGSAHVYLIYNNNNI